MLVKAEYVRADLDTGHGNHWQAKNCPLCAAREVLAIAVAVDVR